MATPVAALIVRVAADVADLKTSVGQVEGSLNNMSSVAKTAAGALAGAFAAMDIGAGVARIAEMAGQVADLSAQMGISAEAVQRFKFAAEQSGGSIENVATAIKTMATNLNDPSAGAKDALEALNLNLADLQAMSPDRAFVAISSAIKAVPDPLKQSALAVDLLGGRAAVLLPAIKAGIDEVGAAAPVMRDSTVAALDESGDKWAEVQGKIDALKANALGPLVDMFLGLPNILQVAGAGIASFTPSLESLGLLVMSAGGPTAALASLKTGAMALMTYLSGAGAAALTAFATFFTTTLPTAFGAVIAFLGPQGLIALALIALAAIWYKWGDDIKAIVAKVYNAVKEWLFDKLNAIWNGVKQKIEDVKSWFKGMYDAVVGNSYVPDMITQIGVEFGKLDTVMVNPTTLATQKIKGLFEGLATELFGAQGGLFGSIMQSGLSMLFGPAGPVAGLISQGIAALGDLARKGLKSMWDGIRGIFGTDEEARDVNPARDAFLAQFGGPGTGEGSGFLNLAAKLTELTGEEGGGSLFRALAQADSMREFNDAVRAIVALLNGGGALSGGGAFHMPGVPAIPQYDLSDPLVQDWLARNPRDEHRIEEALGIRLRRFAMGSGGLQDFGGGTLAMLHGRERVQTEGQMLAERGLEAKLDALLAAFKDQPRRNAAAFQEALLYGGVLR